MSGNEPDQHGVLSYRVGYRESEIPRKYSGWLHFWCMSGTSIAIIAGCLVLLKKTTPLEWLTVPLTYLYANFAEYIGHRGPMHHRRKGLSTVYRHTTIHHRFYTDQYFGFEGPRDFHALLLPPSLLVFFFGLFAVPVGVVLYSLVTPNTGLLFVATAVFYFLTYEWLHFCYHLRDEAFLLRFPFVRKLRQLHLNHHNPRLMNQYNFNITIPIFDWLFGTIYKKERAKKGVVSKTKRA